MKGKNVLVVISAGFALALAGCTNVEPEHTHSYVYDSGKAASCVESGILAHYTCEGCDKIFDADKKEVTLDSLTINPTGHVYGSLIGEVPASCTESGVAAHYVCSECEKYFDADKKETTLEALAIPATDHKYVHVDEVPATCKKEGVAEHYECEDCDMLFDLDKKETTAAALKIDKAAHTLTHHPAVPPTYEADGSIEYWSCDVCEKNFTDAQGTTEATSTVVDHLTHWSGKYKFGVNCDYTTSETETTTAVVTANQSNIYAALTLGEAKKYFSVSATFLINSIDSEPGVGMMFKFSESENRYLDIALKDKLDDSKNNKLINRWYYNNTALDGYYDASKSISNDDIGVNYLDGVIPGANAGEYTVKMTFEKLADKVNFYVGSTLLNSETISRLHGRSEIFTNDMMAIPTVFFRNNDAASHTVVISEQTVTELTLAQANEAVYVDEVDYGCSKVAAHWENAEKGLYFSADGSAQVTLESLTTGEGHTISHVNAQDATYEEEGCIEHYKCNSCGRYFSDIEGKTELSASEVILPKLSHWVNKMKFGNNPDYTISETNDGVTTVETTNVSNMYGALTLRSEPIKHFKVSTKFVVNSIDSEPGVGMVFKHNENDRYLALTLKDKLDDGNNNALINRWYYDNSDIGSTYYDINKKIFNKDIGVTYLDGVTATGNAGEYEITMTFEKLADKVNFYVGSTLLNSQSLSVLTGKCSSITSDLEAIPAVFVRNNNAASHTFKISGQSVTELTLAEANEAVYVEEVDYGCSKVAAHWENAEKGLYFSADGKTQVTLESLTTGEGHLISKVVATAPSYEADGCVEHFECSQCKKVFSDELGEHEIAASSVVIHKFVDLDVDNAKVVKGTNNPSAVANGHIVTATIPTGAGEIHLPFAGVSAMSKFRSEASFTTHQCRIDVALGMRFTADGKDIVFFFTAKDMLNNGTNAIITDAYMNGHSKYNLQDQNLNPRHSNIPQADLGNWDGFTDVDLEGGDQGHSLTTNLSLVKDSEGVKFYIGTTLRTSYTYAQLNAVYGDNFITADTLVAPTVSFRGHSNTVDTNGIVNWAKVYAI